MRLIRSTASRATGSLVVTAHSQNLRRQCALSRARHKAHYPEPSVIRNPALAPSLMSDERSR